VFGTQRNTFGKSNLSIVALLRDSGGQSQTDQSQRAGQIVVQILQGTIPCAKANE
jgi:hypothetical protein